MFILVSYDVVDDASRGRVAKVLLNYGRRVQKSVFECILDEKRFLDMKGRLEKHIDFGADSVRYYFLCQRCVPAVQITGYGTVSEDISDDVLIV